MTDTSQINVALDRVFNQEGERIVFWNDPENEFSDFIGSQLFLVLGKANVNIIRLDQVGALETKIRVEQENPTGRFLLYSPAEEPDYEQDWLLDIRLYSKSFRADRASILLDELGLKSHHLRDYLGTRRKFFDNKDRLQKIKPLLTQDDTAADIDRKMIAVVLKSDQAEFPILVQSLFNAFTENIDEIDLDLPPIAWDQIEKFDLAQPFWEMVKSNFAYADESPNLKNLLIRLLVTDFAHHLKKGVPSALAHQVLPPQGRPNTVVCLAQWRDSSSKGSSYDRLSEEIGKLIYLDNQLHGLEVSDLVDVMTFLAVEKAIASQLRQHIQHTAKTINAQDIRTIVTRRQAGHWASPNVTGAAEVPRKALHATYNAMMAAAEFFELRNQYQNGFVFTEASALYAAYESHLYLFDQIYRHFCENADHAEKAGWNIVKTLREEIENCYANWYLPNLALVWGRFVDPESATALLGNWRIEGIKNQNKFFYWNVRPQLAEGENRRVYVVISDALRYEAAHELAQELNGKYRLEATLNSQLGVIPSITSLGMASLLPHDKLEIRRSGEVFVDGKPTATSEQRNAVLESVGGLVINANDLLALKKEHGRDLVKDKRVIYIYHDTIDALGDKAVTEHRTFDAVRDAIGQLSSLVSYIVNNLNGNHVVVTADHGFIFTESAPGETEKSPLGEKPLGTVKGNKRYLIGYKLPNHESAWHGQTRETSGAEGDMEFLIPKGTNRFHFVAGARFVHGGAMLQEIVVPVITVKHRKDKGVREETKVKQVPVHVLGTSHKITTNRHRFELIQVEPVSERVKASNLKIAIYAGDEPVTNIESVTFDSTSDRIDDRKKWVHLVLQDRQYDKKTVYRLVLRDAETNIEQQGVTVIIDRVFNDDF